MAVGDGAGSAEPQHPAPSRCWWRDELHPKIIAGVVPICAYIEFGSPVADVHVRAAAVSLRTAHSPPADDPHRQLARMPAVLKLTGLGRSTIYRWIADGSFPAPVRHGPRAVAWRWSDLDRWTQSRVTTTDD